MRTILLILTVFGLVLVGELGRMVLAAACGAALFLSFRIGYRTGGEDREAAITALSVPLDQSPPKNSETHRPLLFAPDRAVKGSDFWPETQTAQRFTRKKPGRDAHRSELVCKRSRVNSEQIVTHRNGRSKKWVTERQIVQ
ncbi:hypothetical protein [Bradyrhizobium sp. CCH5-F6]|jgi:hypothetical protein|uniref:hypothetical protein n=1 Tax=Bradyrhizobium sp. CCH5-F6 TaxID=1768753 RepID=UPI000769BB52|nr:hypothetical protein [Bradyrhizobium sp. CCH5-F6]